MLQKSNGQRVLGLIFDCPTSGLNAREIARRLSIAPPTALRMVRLLQKAGMVKVEAVANSMIVRGNIDNPRFIRAKRADNMERLYESGLVDAIMEEAFPLCVVLFGSYSRGEDIESSDIDIMAISEKGKAGDAIPHLRRFEKTLSRRVHAEVFSSKEFGRLSREMRNSIANGIVLEGYLAVA
jgi:predicted nucleotidyltransferase